MTPQRTRQIEGPCSAPRQLKKSFKGLKQRRGVAGRKRGEKCFPDEASLICRPGKLMIFLEKSKQKDIELVARPGRSSRRLKALRVSLRHLLRTGSPLDPPGGEERFGQIPPPSAERTSRSRPGCLHCPLQAL